MKMVQALALAVTLGAVHSSAGHRNKAEVLLAANDWKGEAVVRQSIRVSADPEKEAAVTKRYEAPTSKRYASSSEAANFVQPGAVLRRPAPSGVTYVAAPTGAQAVSTAVGSKTEPSAAATGYGGGHGGGHRGGHGGYFQYARVPGYDTYEFGYRKGNPHHFQERHETRHGPHFRTKQRWGDKYGGYGEHYWEYNHAPKYH